MHHPRRRVFQWTMRRLSDGKHHGYLHSQRCIDLDDECSWTLWKKVNSKFDLQQMIGSVDSLLTEIEERWPVFLHHTYCNRQQRDHIKHLRNQSTDKNNEIWRSLVTIWNTQQLLFTAHKSFSSNSSRRTFH